MAAARPSRTCRSTRSWPAADPASPSAARRFHSERPRTLTRPRCRCGAWNGSALGSTPCKPGCAGVPRSRKQSVLTARVKNPSIDQGHGPVGVLNHHLPLAVCQRQVLDTVFVRPGPVQAMNNSAFPSASACGLRWLISEAFGSGLVSSVASPPAAETFHSPEVFVGAK